MDLKAELLALQLSTFLAFDERNENLITRLEGKGILSAALKPENLLNYRYQITAVGDYQNKRFKCGTMCMIYFGQGSWCCGRLQTKGKS